ncbi:MAG: hypothetical protein IJV66_04555 [Firmicutes bacterium]|nr:hypothetical protein [Bacillota bacterium]
MNENYFEEFDCSRSIRDFEFTRRAVHDMNRILDSEAFENMDAKEIFRYLSEEMSIVVFSDFLKRYLYELAEIDEPFGSIPDEVYIDIIRESFKENHMAFSFEPTTAKPTAIIKRWLRQSATTRDTVFLLGFGLRMVDTDVDDFLQRVLLEESFDFENYRECIFWHCYHNDLAYAKAKELMQKYDEMSEDGELNNSLWGFMKSNPKMYLPGEEQLLLYLEQLKIYNKSGDKSRVAEAEFRNLYEDACRIVNNILYDGKNDEITPADVEKVLCSGIPVTESGNMMKMSASILNKQFAQKRMTRQRMGNIISGKIAVERFDLVTLLFLRYAEEVEPDWPAERYMQYIDEINSILNRCGMMDIYPVNPYEAFVLMCILSDYPLGTFSEVWERSYEQEV